MTYIHTELVHNTKSAQEIVPIIMQLLKPESVIDVGCGTGTWLCVFEKYGVKDILGVDGDYVDRQQLHIHEDSFIPYDLSMPIQMDREFDLAICLEVAEHLSEGAADSLIKSLTSIGKFVLFSAAIPNQGGQGHINEKSPKYWETKFNSYGYQLRDCVRGRIWSNPEVDWWYKQNIFLFVPENTSLLENSTSELTYVIHPDLYNWRVQQILNLDPDLINLDLPSVSLPRAIVILLKSLKNSFLKSRHY